MMHNQSPSCTVLFATDQAYVAHLATAIYSLLDNNQRRRFKIIVFTSGIDDEHSKNLTVLANSFGSELRFEYLSDRLFDGLILNHHFQKSNYYRLYAADIIQEDRCLYLDSDLVVTGPLDSIIDLDLDGCYLGAVENPGFVGQNELRMNPDSKYFNSGVMLINLKKWRTKGVRENVLKTVREIPEAIQFVDQCGLNSVIDGKWCELPAEYNVQSCFLEGKLPEAVSSVDEVMNRVKVIHFTGSSKPWHFVNKHPFRAEYWKYRNRTVYKSRFSDDFSIGVLMRTVTPSFVKRVVKSILERTEEKRST